MIKIIHISDLHIKADPKHRHNEVVKTAMDKIAKDYADYQLVITGDIIDGVKPHKEYIIALDLIPKNAIVVPGNHDFDYKGIIPISWINKCRGWLGLVPYPDRWPWFRSKYSTHNIEDKKTTCSFILLNSNDNKFGADGEIGKFILGKLDMFLRQIGTHNIKKRHYSIVCLHHHPWERGFACQLVDSKKFIDMVKGRADIVLFGHKHKQEVRNIAGTEFFAAGALYNDRTLTVMSIDDNGKFKLKYVKI